MKRRFVFCDPDFTARTIASIHEPSITVTGWRALFFSISRHCRQTGTMALLEKEPNSCKDS